MDDIANKIALNSRMNFREKRKLITRGPVRFLELTEFPLIPRDGLQKEAEFKQ